MGRIQESRRSLGARDPAVVPAAVPMAAVCSLHPTGRPTEAVCSTLPPSARTFSIAAGAMQLPLPGRVESSVHATLLTFGSYCLDFT